MLRQCSGHGRFPVKIDFRCLDARAPGLEIIVKELEDTITWYVWLTVEDQVIYNLGSGSVKGARGIKEAQAYYKRLLYRVKTDNIQLNDPPQDIVDASKLPLRPFK